MKWPTKPWGWDTLEVVVSNRPNDNPWQEFYPCTRSVSSCKINCQKSENIGFAIGQWFLLLSYINQSGFKIIQNLPNVALGQSSCLVIRIYSQSCGCWRAAKGFRRDMGTNPRAILDLHQWSMAGKKSRTTSQLDDENPLMDDIHINTSI